MMVLDFVRDESGSAALNYGMVVSLIILAAILAFTHIGGTLTGTLESINPSQHVTSPATGQEHSTALN